MGVLRRVASLARRAARRALGRRAVMAGGVAIIAVVVVAVGTLWYQRPGGDPVKVSGVFGQEPKVAFTDGAQPDGDFTMHVAVKGNGPKVSERDLVVTDFVTYTWNGTSHTRLDNSFTGGRTGVIRPDEVIPGLRKGLVGQAVGSRVVMVIPPEDGYGPQGDKQAGVKGTDTLVYVADLLATYPSSTKAQGPQRKVDDSRLPTVSATAKAPAMEIPESDPPDKLQVETLIAGSGPAVGEKQLMVTQYQALIWRTGKVIDSSWTRGEVAPLTMDGVIPGLAEGLKGKRAGSRVMMVIPPEDGYGAQGVEKRGIRGIDTLVFLVDILGVH